jgi:hypothetical protein
VQSSDLSTAGGIPVFPSLPLGDKRTNNDLRQTPHLSSPSWTKDIAEYEVQRRIHQEPLRERETALSQMTLHRRTARVLDVDAG